MTAPTVHASAVVVGGRGVLIRGPSGAGKSTLALDLLDEARLWGLPAALVGDDRVRLDAVDGAVIVRPAPALAGLVEVRGLGIVRLEAAASATIALVVDLVGGPVARMPPPENRRVSLLDIEVAALQIQVREPRAARLVRLALGYDVESSTF